MLSRHPVWTTVGVIALLVIIALVIVLSAVDEPLRRYAEREANERLPGYRVEIGRLTLHPLTLSVDLHDLVVRQEAHSDPPLAAIPLVTADARLSPLFNGTLAADVHIEAPVFTATRPQVDWARQSLETEDLEQEAEAWQDRLREMMAFEGAVRLTNGRVTYIGAPAAEPVRLEGLDLAATRLTNRPAEGESYPSDLRVSVRLLDDARMELSGQADLLAKPYPAVKFETNVTALDSSKALSIVGRNDLPIRSGTVEMAGAVEFGPERKAVTIERVLVEQPAIVYVHDSSGSRAAAQAKDAAQQTPEWQDRFLDLFPVRIQEAVVRDGSVTYRHGPNEQPFRIVEVNATARNISNSRTKAGEHPSQVRMSARLPDKAHMHVEGKADLLAKPTPSVRADVTLEDLRLTTLMPVVGDYNVRLRDGSFDMAAHVAYGRERTVLSIDSFLLEGAKIDYVHQETTKGREAERARRGAKQADEVHKDPSIVLTVGHGKVLDSEVGFVNRSTSPDYRLFMSDLNMDMDNFSNRLEQGTGVVKVTGKFMGSGPTVVTGTFRPEKPRPDFELAVKIIKTNVTTLNDVMRAHGNLDTHGGVFSFFSELSVKDNRIDGYVKPLMRDVDVYDPKKDQDKTAGEQLYKAVVGGAMTLLENNPRDAVAAKAEVSGDLDQPDVSTWQIIGSLMQNAFFNAILPGFAGRT